MCFHEIKQKKAKNFEKRPELSKKKIQKSTSGFIKFENGQE